MERKAASYSIALHHLCGIVQQKKALKKKPCTAGPAELVRKGRASEYRFFWIFMKKKGCNHYKFFVKRYIHTVKLKDLRCVHT